MYQLGHTLRIRQSAVENNCHLLSTSLGAHLGRITHKAFPAAQDNSPSGVIAYLVEYLTEYLTIQIVNKVMENNGLKKK